MKKGSFFDVRNVIGRKLRKVRIKKHLSQEGLAAKMQERDVKMSRQAISEIERNQRQVMDYELKCFCEVLEIDPKDLLEDFLK